MGSRTEVAVFTDTNLGTHIAMAISPDTTAGQFKRELESAHLNCFPKLGEIRVNGIMVKRKSCFYYLPESFPIKNAFQSLEGSWFIYMEVCRWSCSDQPCLSECMATEVGDHISTGNIVTDTMERKSCVRSPNNKKNSKKKKRRIERFHYLKAASQEVLRASHLLKKKKRKRVNKNYMVNGFEKGHLEVVVPEERLFASGTEAEHRDEWNYDLAVETPSETSSESVLSISGIIRKYFSNCDGVDSCTEITSAAIKTQRKEQAGARRYDNFSSMQVHKTPVSLAKTLPRDKLKRTKVGNRLLEASNNLGIFACKQKGTTSLRTLRDEKSSVRKSYLATNLVFEIIDEDD